MHLPFRRPIRRSISKILEIESERTRTRVTSSKDKVLSPDCEVKTGTVNIDDTIEVHFV